MGSQGAHGVIWWLLGLKSELTLSPFAFLRGTLKDYGVFLKVKGPGTAIYSIRWRVFFPRQPAAIQVEHQMGPLKL